MNGGEWAGPLRSGGRAMRDLFRTDWKGIPCGFILSTGRTGTQRLAQLIGYATVGVLSLHEPRPDLFDIGEAVARGTLSREEAAGQVRRARAPQRKQLRRRGTSRYVESNNNAAYLADVLRSVFDTPRFVHVVRDGRAAVRSLYSKGVRSRRPGREEALFMDHDDIRCRLSAEDFPDDPFAREWPEMSRFQRVCWYWARKNALIRESLLPYTDAVLVRFEDIFDPENRFRGFWEIIRFLGLEDRVTRSEPEIQNQLTMRSNQVAAHRLPRPAEWPPELRSAFERIAGSEQRLYYP